MCGLKEIFEGAGFLKKSSCKSHFSVWKKLNLIRFIKALIKEFTPHPLRFAQHLLPKGEGLLSAILYLVSKYRDLSRYFTESLGQAFSKACRVVGQSPTVLVL